MRIWIVEIGEPLPLETGKRLLRYGQFSAFLAARGHEVRWWTCDFSHAVKAHVAPAGTHQLASGVALNVLHAPGYRSNVSLARLRHHRAFARALAAALEREETPPDCILCPIPTIENARVIHDYAVRHRVPYIIDVRDNWPDDLVRRVPRLVQPLARVALRGLFSAARTAARDAAFITGVSRLQVEYGLSLAGRPLDARRDHVFHHGYTRSVVSPQAHTEAMAWWRARGLRAAKVISFVGTLGVSFDFEPVFAAARKLWQEGRRDIQVVVAGAGDARDSLIERGNELILFPGWIDMARIDALLANSVAAVAPYIPNTTMSLPNKFFEYFAYGLPVLSSCSGESAELIAEHGVGLQYDPSTPDDFYQCLLRITEHPELARAMGKAALSLFSARFDQSLLFSEMEARIREVAPS